MPLLKLLDRSSWVVKEMLLATDWPKFTALVTFRVETWGPKSWPGVRRGVRRLLAEKQI